MPYFSPGRGCIIRGGNTTADRAASAGVVPWKRSRPCCRRRRRRRRPPRPRGPARGRREPWPGPRPRPPARRRSGWWCRGRRRSSVKSGGVEGAHEVLDRHQLARPGLQGGDQVRRRAVPVTRYSVGSASAPARAWGVFEPSGRYSTAVKSTGTPSCRQPSTRCSLRSMHAVDVGPPGPPAAADDVLLHVDQHEGGASIESTHAILRRAGCHGRAGAAGATNRGADRPATTPGSYGRPRVQRPPPEGGGAGRTKGWDPRWHTSLV